MKIKKSTWWLTIKRCLCNFELTLKPDDVYFIFHNYFVVLPDVDLFFHGE